MILAAAIGLGLQLFLDLKDALIFSLIAGLVVAQLIPTGPMSCSLPPPTDDAERDQSS